MAALNAFPVNVLDYILYKGKINPRHSISAGKNKMNKINIFCFFLEHVLKKQLVDCNLETILDNGKSSKNHRKVFYFLPVVCICFSLNHLEM